MEHSYLKHKIRLFWAKIKGEKYLRYGQCHQCGKCCTNIAVRNHQGVIRSKEDFERLKKFFPTYAMLEIMDEESTSEHLVFKCKNLDETTNCCKIYTSRPLMCRLYPSANIFKMGAVLAEDCGYYFRPLISFKNIMKTIKKAGTA